MDRWKSRGGKSQRGEEPKREDQRRERVRRKKMQVREKVGKSRNTVFFQWFVAPEGRKVGSLKRRVRSHVVRWDEKLHAVVSCEAHFQIKLYTPNTPTTDHFWKLRCRKSARRCGAKHISKSKCTKHTMLGPLLEVEMSKKSHAVWREAHFQVKMLQNWRSRTTFGSWDVEKVHAVVARSTFRSQKCKKRGRSTFGRSVVILRGRHKGLCTLSKVSKTWGFCSSLSTKTHHYTTLHYKLTL